MRLLLITQDDPLFLPEALEILLDKICGRHEVVGAVILAASPFGRRESFLSKARKTYSIFGFNFFLRYAFLFVWRKLVKRKSVERVLKDSGVQIIRLNKSVNHQESVSIISTCNPDVLVSIAGNEIFRRPVLEIAPHGCLNLHTSKLPKYRGLMPTFWVLKNGEDETAVSVFLVDEGIDSGPIIVQENICIGVKTQEQLIRETKSLGMACISKALDILEKGQPDLIENDSSQATYFSFPTRDDVREFVRVGAKFY